MTRRIATMPILLVVLLGGLLPAAATAATALPLPVTMAAVGDSITQAASSAGALGVDAPQNSWSTGTSGTVNSHYLRLLALGAPISGQNNNRSVSGAKVGGLDAQMQNVVALRPDYLTVLIGGNDLCTDTAAAMTSVTDFRAQFLAAMTTLAAGSPNTNAYVVSIPDAYQLWSLFRNDGWARFIWSVGGVCQSLLANPTSTQLVDVQRRQAVRQRNIDYNTQLADVCAAFASRCRFDSNAVFNTQFAGSDISGDYFHPSVAGQAKLASVSWSAGYTWTTSTPPPPEPTWVGGLAATTTTSRNAWTAIVTIQVVDQHGPVGGVSVAGTWSAGSGGTSCTTNSAGSCSVTSSSLSKKSTATVRYTVTGLAKVGWTYVATRNAATYIIVAKP